MRVVVIILLLLATPALAFRINRPATFSLPWTQDQITQLNNSLEDLYNLQKGEFNFDIVTSSKTGADNGDIWFLQTGATVTLQFKFNNQVFSIKPEDLP